MLSCPPTKFQNISEYPWNDYDIQMLKYAEKRCQEVYSEAGCVRIFRKFGERDYTVICGKEGK